MIYFNAKFPIYEFLVFLMLLCCIWHKSGNVYMNWLILIFIGICISLYGILKYLFGDKYLYWNVKTNQKLSCSTNCYYFVMSQTNKLFNDECVLSLWAWFSLFFISCCHLFTYAIAVSFFWWYYHVMGTYTFLHITFTSLMVLILVSLFAKMTAHSHCNFCILLCFLHNCNLSCHINTTLETHSWNHNSSRIILKNIIYIYIYNPYHFAH